MVIWRILSGSDANIIPTNHIVFCWLITLLLQWGGAFWSLVPSSIMVYYVTIHNGRKSDHNGPERWRRWRENWTDGEGEHSRRFAHSSSPLSFPLLLPSSSPPICLPRHPFGFSVIYPVVFSDCSSVSSSSPFVVFAVDFCASSPSFPSFVVSFGSVVVHCGN